MKLPRLPASALHVAPALEVLGGTAVAQSLLGAPPPFALVDAQVGEREERSGQRERGLAHVGGPLAAQHLPSLFHLQAIAHGAAQGRLHGRVDARRGAAVGVTHQAAETTQFARVLEVGREGAPADLDVEHQGGGAAGYLLGHDAGGDEPVAVDGRGHVAQRVEETVGRHQAFALTHDSHPDALQLPHQLTLGQLHAKAGDRLQLVERTASAPQAAARHLAEDRPAGGHQGRQNSA